MPTPARKPKEEETDGTPLALIESTDELFILPLREFLETHQCRVTYNTEDGIQADYHIIAGDLIYVKSILAHSGHKGSRRILILWNVSKSEIQTHKEFVDQKIIVNPPDILGSREVSEIFFLLFSSGKKVVDFGGHRRNIPNKKPFDIESKNQIRDDGVTTTELNVREPNHEARQRVDRVIGDVFGRADWQKNNEDFRKTKTEKNAKKQKKGGTERTLKKNIFIFIKAMSLLFLVPTLWYGVMGGISILSIRFMAKNIVNGKTNEAMISYTIGKSALQSNEMLLGLVRGPLLVAGGEETVRDQERLLSLLRSIFDSSRGAIALFDTGKDFSQHFFESAGSIGEGQTSAATVFEKLHNELYSVRTNLALASASLTVMMQRKAFPFSVGLVFREVGDVEAHLEKIRETLLSMDQLLTLYPALAGFSRERTYLLLLQNSSELRPTGGFIGSIGILSFRDGKLNSFEIQDVYDIDGQLKGHVDPPEPIARFLGNEHWYLRDSNWDPDFQVSGARAAWFYEKITGRTVDGVIAVDSLFLVDLLRAIGPIDISDYSDRITADNFFGKSLYYTKENFFPGSTQKKDFLGSLARELVAKITSGDRSMIPKVFYATQEALRKKDLLLFVKDQEPTGLIKEYGWGGVMRHTSGCETEEAQRVLCIADYMYVNEANLSVNKVNYFVKREATLTVTLDSRNQITEGISMLFTNTSVSGAGGGGGYLPYIRVYIPEDGLITSVNLTSGRVPERLPGGGTIASPYYEMISAPRGLKGIGLLFPVEAKRQEKLTISWRREKPVEFRDGISVYEYVIEKQPGVDQSLWNVSIRTPRSWKVVQAKEGRRGNSATIVGESGILANENTLEYNKALDSDIRFKLYLAE